MSISYKEFSITQPGFPQVSETDVFYLELANELENKIQDIVFFKEIPEALAKRISLTLADYLQDIISDAGLWRSFITANRQLYNFTVPFYDTDDSYIDFELNNQDVRFLVWYVVVMLWDDGRFISPFNAKLLELADICYKVLETKYEDAPVPEQFNISRGLEFKDPEDRGKIYSLGNWLFLHSYLLTPAFAMSMRELASDIDSKDPDFGATLNNRLEEAMMNNPTGPLALFTPEWVYLMIEGKLPVNEEINDSEPHKYYQAFTKFTEGKEIMFFDSYDELNNFFIRALGWESNEEHLPQVKGQRDYILMVNHNKGMLLAVNIARCVKSPDNILYDQEYAKNNAFTLLTERGVCPGDLLKYIIKNNWLPDAHFPEDDNCDIVIRNADFIARSYLQLYYRGD